MSFIVKRYGEIRMDGDGGKAYLALIELIKTKTKNQDLKEALLRSAKKETTYLDYRKNKLVFVIWILSDF